jgi:hypothetical protein
MKIERHQPPPVYGRRRVPTEVLRVKAEPGDVLDAVGYTELTVIVQLALPHPGVANAGHEYMVYLPDDDPAGGGTLVAAYRGTFSDPIAMGREVVRDFLVHCPVPPSAPPRP